MSKVFVFLMSLLALAAVPVANAQDDCDGEQIAAGECVGAAADDDNDASAQASEADPDTAAEDDTVASEEEASEEDGRAVTAASAADDEAATPAPALSSDDDSEWADLDAQDGSELDAASSDDLLRTADVSDPAPASTPAPNARAPADPVRAPPMGTKLYVGNLAYSVREDQLHELFGEFGTVTSARIMVDDSGRPKGFGFVEMNSPEQAAAAIRGVTARYIDGQEELLPFEIDKICPRSIDNRYDSSSPTGC